MSFKSRLAAIITVLLISIGSDQVVKHVATAFLKDALPISFLSDFVRLQYAENRGIMLSIGATLSPAARFWIFVIVVGLLLVAMVAYLLWTRELDRTQVIAWSLIVSGGLGNLIDRITRDGVVIDYISVGLGIVRTAVFNLADLLVFVGVFLLLLHGRKKERMTEPKEEQGSNIKNEM